MVPKIIGSAPVLVVADVQASARYYVDKVGFTRPLFWGEPPCFCIVRRDGFHLMLAQTSDTERIQPNWKILEKTSDQYFWVNDAEAMYRDLCERGATIDYELYKTEYGCLEFGIQDIDGYDISFGQDLSSV